jgi:Tfp pilus assembly protein PilF/cytochrome c553
MRSAEIAFWLAACVWATMANADEGTPQYVGRARCAACHAEESTRWAGSQHDLAMQEARDASVLGDFNDASFEQFGVLSRFYRKDGRFIVRTDGPDGTLQDYPIKYTFGVFPLQQYLIEFPGRRLQALDIGWDSRPEEQGGQRWMHLHPDDPVRHDDVLHWTGPNLNWNYMCADCHSTNLKKGYDAASDSYHTTWSEIDVSCEACHGPGSRHVEWAEAKAKGKTPDLPDIGLTARFDERTGVAWQIDPATGKAKRSEPRKATKEIQVCARCHSRRSQLTEQPIAGQPYLDGFRPALLTEGLYYPDGQIQDEVYVWGSLLQSKMYRAGITCSDCHDPHAANVRLPGDTLCYQRHPSDRYATAKHHFHPEAQLNLGTLYADQGRYQDAELAYRKALRLQSRFIPAYVNMAHLLSGLEREQEAGGFLRRGLELNPKSADLEHALGLSLVRQTKPDEAVSELAKAAELAPDNARYSYVYAVALQSEGKLDEAIQVLEVAHRRRPGDVDTLFALVIFNRDSGRPKEALKYARELRELAPDNPSVDQLVRELDASPR